jgi:hypothetical protein
MNEKDRPTALPVFDFPVMPEEIFELKLKGQHGHSMPSKQLLR